MGLSHSHFKLKRPVAAGLEPIGSSPSAYVAQRCRRNCPTCCETWRVHANHAAGTMESTEVEDGLTMRC